MRRSWRTSRGPPPGRSRDRPTCARAAAARAEASWRPSLRRSTPRDARATLHLDAEANLLQVIRDMRGKVARTERVVVRWLAFSPGADDDNVRTISGSRCFESPPGRQLRRCDRCPRRSHIHPRRRAGRVSHSSWRRATHGRRDPRARTRRVSCPDGILAARRPRALHRARKRSGSRWASFERRLDVWREQDPPAALIEGDCQCRCGADDIHNNVDGAVRRSGSLSTKAGTSATSITTARAAALLVQPCISPPSRLH